MGICFKSEYIQASALGAVLVFLSTGNVGWPASLDHHLHVAEWTNVVKSSVTVAKVGLID